MCAWNVYLGVLAQLVWIMCVGVVFDVRVICLSDVCLFCVSVLIVWNGVVERSFPLLG